jgi:DNA-binding MarR family transcriptional regulator
MSTFRLKIKALIVKCSRPSAVAAAKILVELYKNPKQSYSSFIKISGFSVGGLSKHIAMLKRRGLIIRTAYQQYELTNLALQMMRDSVFING